jgi:hypothetical protein
LILTVVDGLELCWGDVGVVFGDLAVETAVVAEPVGLVRSELALDEVRRAVLVLVEAGVTL